MRKKGILLGFIEAMNFIDEQDRPPAADPAPLLGDLNHLAQLWQPARNGRKRFEVGFRVQGDQMPQGGLAAPGWSPQNHRRDCILLNGETKRSSRTHDLGLSQQLVQRVWAHAIG